MSTTTAERPQPPSTPDKKPTWEHFDTLVRIRVGKGDSQEVFEVYRGLLKFYPVYFRAAIDNMDQGLFAQQEKDTIILPDEDPAIFAIFKDWLFTRELASSSATEIDEQTAIELWCFGDRRAMPMLQNDAVNSLHSHIIEYKNQPTGSLIDAWQNTSEGSQLRRYMTFSVTRRSNNKDFFDAKYKDRYTVEILMEVARELVTRPEYMKRPAFAKIDMCAFHVHEEGIRCGEKK